MKNITRTLTALLTLALIMALCLPGCGPKDKGPLRICLDLDIRSTQANQATHDFEKLLETLEESGGAQEFEIELVPLEGEERMGALTRLHTEIMSGEGPDLFIINSGWQDDLVFPYPEKAARNGLLLNLDKLMEKSQYADWDQQVQTILNAGKTEKGQYIIPLSYQFNMSCFLKEDVTHTPSTDITWEQMAASEDIIDLASISFDGGSPQKKLSIGDRTVHNTLGKLADYDKEELLFTADEVRARIHKNLELMDLSDNGEFGDTPTYYQALVGPGFNTHVSSFHIQADTIKEDVPLTYIPLYSKTGGVTAAVRSYAAISAGSRHKEEAFLVLDYLLGLESQQGEGFYNQFLAGAGTFLGFPMDSRLMSEEYPVSLAGGAKKWSLTDENFQGLCAVRDAITAVNFFDTVTFGLYNLESDCLDVHTGYTEGDVDALIDEACRVLAMSLKES